MTKSQIKKYSLLGLLLVAASAITKAFIPSNNHPINNGKLVASTTGNGQQKTCIPTFNSAVCTATISETTSANDGGQGFARTNGTSENRFSSLVGDDGMHSSGSPI